MYEYPKTGAIGRARSLTGVAVFDGNGNYSFTGQTFDSNDTSNQAKAYSFSGTYSVTSGGLFQMQNPIDPVENSLVYYAALRKAGVPAELHVFVKGGHAFGLRRTTFPITEWPELAEKWLTAIGMISK